MRKLVHTMLTTEFHENYAAFLADIFVDWIQTILKPCTSISSVCKTLDNIKPDWILCRGHGDLGKSVVFTKDFFLPCQFHGQAKLKHLIASSQHFLIYNCSFSIFQGENAISLNGQDDPKLQNALFTLRKKQFITYVEALRLRRIDCIVLTGSVSEMVWFSEL